MHFGGLDLQEVFYNLPDDESVDVFEVVIAKQDDYFALKQNKIYERHLLRLLKQEPKVLDQIVEKCASIELRKKILQMGDDVLPTSVDR